MGLLHLLDAFVFYQGPGGASAKLLNISNWVSVMKTADYCAQTTIADGMLVYRSYITYGRSWRVAAGLSILWLGGLACGIYIVILEATLHQTSTLVASRFTPMALSVGAITLVLNTIASSLIVYRIWSIYRANNDISEENLGGTTALRRAIRIIVESGAVYTLSIIILFVLDVTGSNSLYLTSDCVIQIIGIVFNLIIIRVEKGRTAEHTTYDDSKDLVSLQFQRRSTMGETTTHASALEAGEASRA
ncbi:hypothetical protein EWM64_g8225 [Hericium alpestre]|uniref:Uncharacterized protein n=1 Tax=Hericium alpestre TaxID=135208 RepID=A0A4Y9ZQQ0_9AGAM|nr:hypothetical protein EWM64_g8225 [Hericium alpestre]